MIKHNEVKNIVILGSTGSIGTQTLDVVKMLNASNYEVNVLALSAHSNIDLLEQQAKEFGVTNLCVFQEDKANELKARLKHINNKSVTILSGLDGLLELVKISECNLIVNSLVGNIGLKPTLEAIKHKKDIALANKEVLVTGGELIMPLLGDLKLLPIDSEHSAIFQSLAGNDYKTIKKILLTASGGPFFGSTIEELKNKTVEEALRHPKWKMGSKITIDSSTLMNKGLEVIEAKHLFNVDVEQIEVLVHRQSIVHSMVMYNDNSVIAQLGSTDMRIPIQYAITYPKRVENSLDTIDFLEHSNLTFEKPDMETFKCLKLAFQSLNQGGAYPTLLNGANEVAVDNFLKGRIKFLDIANVVENTMDTYNSEFKIFCLDELFIADEFSRKYSQELINKLTR